MKTKLISKIQNQMEPYLSQEQYLKLTNSLLNTLKDIEITDKNNELSEIDNFKLLKLFLSAKQVEGCSDKTITYYYGYASNTATTETSVSVKEDAILTLTDLNPIVFPGELHRNLFPEILLAASACVYLPQVGFQLL